MWSRAGSVMEGSIMMSGTPVRSMGGTGGRDDMEDTRCREESVRHFTRHTVEGGGGGEFGCIILGLVCERGEGLGTLSLPWWQLLTLTEAGQSVSQTRKGGKGTYRKI